MENHFGAAICHGTVYIWLPFGYIVLEHPEHAYMPGQLRRRLKRKVHLYKVNLPFNNHFEKFYILAVHLFH